MRPVPYLLGAETLSPESDPDPAVAVPVHYTALRRPPAL